MSTETIDKGISRLAYQFSDSEKFIEFLTAFLDQFQYLQDQNVLLATLRYLETSQGVQLDGVGEIVGLPRPYRTIDAAGLFGFLNDPTSKGFGTLDDADVGGNFYDGSLNQVLVGDDLYRLLIEAKIIQNQTAMVVDDTTRLISLVFGGASVRYIPLIDMEARYDIGKTLDAFEQSLIPDLPILIGLSSVTYHQSLTGDFGFDGDDDALGFGDLNDAGLGGPFSKIIVP